MNIVKYRTREPALSPAEPSWRFPVGPVNANPALMAPTNTCGIAYRFRRGRSMGLNCFTPYQNELHVTTREGRLIFDGDFGPPPDADLQWPPFRTFGEKFYTYQILLDLKVGEGRAIRTEPHPRFYADSTNTVPIAVPALLRNWWPMMFFIVFKSPPEGATHVFRPGEPFAQVIVLPEESDVVVEEMGEDAQANCRLGVSMPVALRYRLKHTGLRHRTPCSMGPIEISSERRRQKSKRVKRRQGHYPCRD
jgi:hypothetical protein